MPDGEHRASPVSTLDHPANQETELIQFNPEGLYNKKKASTDFSAEANRGNYAPQGTAAKREGGELRFAVLGLKMGTMGLVFKAAQRMAAMQKTHGRVLVLMPPTLFKTTICGRW